MSLEPFNRLVKLAVEAFYDDISTKGENQPKTGRSDNHGISAVVLYALTRRQWVREEDLAKELHMHSKQLRRILRFFEEQRLVTRDHRRETAKGAKVFSAAVAATGDRSQVPKEGDEKIKLHTHSYCCLDYSQVGDVVRYKLHRVKTKLKEELENKNTVQEYICPTCSKRYNALDAARLVCPGDDEYFHCENCDGRLLAESDNLAAQDAGDGDDNRRRRHAKLIDMLQNMEVRLKVLMDQIDRVKDLTVPEFRGLQVWEALANRAVRSANGDDNPSTSRSVQAIDYSAMQLPLLGETKVEVEFSGAVKDESNSEIEDPSSLKVLPPWMIKEGMSLTNQQRGDQKPAAMLGTSSALVDLSDKRKPVHDNKENEKRVQNEYAEAYYKAILSKQQERAAELEQQKLSNLSTGRQIGMKSTLDDFQANDEVEWENDSAPAAIKSETYKVGDLNVEASGSCDGDGDENEEDIDWEEG